MHQQDIQAVVNALWKGGAEAVTIQGQRVISTTGIKCEGNSVLLQGVPYPQPYVIEGVGDMGELTTAIAEDPYLQVYREQADDPDIAVGWDLDLAGRAHRAGVRRPARPLLRAGRCADPGRRESGLVGRGGRSASPSVGGGGST